MASRFTSNAAPAQVDRSNLIPFSSRLKEGKALAQDVWSIFACVDLSYFHLAWHRYENTLVLPIYQPIASTWARAT